MNRRTVTIKRKPILNIKGVEKISGYYLVGKQGNQYDKLIEQTKSDKKKRVLWCPYCWRYSVWEFDDNKGSFICGSEGCNVTNNDYHVKTENGLWFDDIPLADLRKLDLGLLKPTNWKSRRNKL